MKRIMGPVVLAGLLAAGIAGARGGDKETTSGSENVDVEKQAGVEGVESWMKSEKLFLWRVHWINHSEIQAGELAQGQGSSDAVKQYGEMLLQDHQQAENRLVELAKEKDVDLQLTKAEYRQVRDKLAKQMTSVMDLAHETGEDFDREFATHMIADHEEAILLVKSYRSKTKDEEIRAYIDEYQPVLQKHLDEAKKLHERFERRPVRGTDEPPDEPMEQPGQEPEPQRH